MITDGNTTCDLWSTENGPEVNTVSTAEPETYWAVCLWTHRRALRLSCMVYARQRERPSLSGHTNLIKIVIITSDFAIIVCPKEQATRCSETVYGQKADQIRSVEAWQRLGQIFRSGDKA